MVKMSNERNVNWPKCRTIKTSTEMRERDNIFATNDCYRNFITWWNICHFLFRHDFKQTRIAATKKLIIISCCRNIWSFQLILPWYRLLTPKTHNHLATIIDNHREIKKNQLGVAFKFIMKRKGGLATANPFVC